MPRLPNRRFDELAPHRTLSLHDVSVAYPSGCETGWPVSGDELIRAYGYRGRREAFKKSIWTFPGVAPKRATQGIVRGSVITLSNGLTGTVTHVGSIAGWMLTEGDGASRRWEAFEVVRVV